jgi:membrane protein DedA with SNARE-associated domain
MNLLYYISIHPMHHFIFLQSLLDLGPILYIVLFIGMFIEGEVLILTTAFLVHEHILHPAPAFVSIVTGAILGDFAWYYIGTSVIEKIPLVNTIVNRLTRRFSAPLLKRPFVLLFISKFTYGLHHALLIQAGKVKLPLRTYTRIVLLSNAIWILIIASLGFFLGASFEAVKHYLKFGEVVLLVGVIIFFLIEHFITIMFKSSDTL